MSHPVKLGKYRIVDVIGEGAMGVVYRAFDPDIERHVAVKTIRPQPDQDAESCSDAGVRFRNEAQAAGRLQHPGIVSVYDYGEEGPTAYIAMEYVEGTSLARCLAQRVRFSDDDIRSIVVQLLDALEHAHAQGVWHRDIKPGNLILTRTGKVKIADFGIARIESVELTKTDLLIGTPSRMAPEQYRGGALDGRVDIYAAGVLLYELLAGRPPFRGSAESLMYQVLNESPPPPSQVDADRPACFDPIVAKAMAKDPAERFGGAAEFRTAVLSTAQRPVDAAVLSEETVLVQPVATMRSAELVANRGADSKVTVRVPSQPSPRWSTAVPAEIDSAVLSRVEAALAGYVGPIARVLVRRAARECSDEESLRLALGEHVTDDDARARFIGSSASTQTSTGRSTRAFSNAATDPALATPAGNLSEAWIQNVQRVLARHIGPIAKVVMKRAIDRSTDRVQVLLSLADAIPASSMREEIVAELARVHDDDGRAARDR